MIEEYEVQNKQVLIDYGMKINRELFQGKIDKQYQEDAIYDEWQAQNLRWSRYFEQIFEYASDNQLTYNTKLKK